MNKVRTIGLVVIVGGILAVLFALSNLSQRIPTASTQAPTSVVSTVDAGASADAEVRDSL